MNEKAEKWSEIQKRAGLEGLKAFRSVWYKHERLSPEQMARLRSLHTEQPLDTEDFKVWLKQRTRQLYEGSILEASRGSGN
ncbi:MAG: hypothetical protein Q7J73_01940 [Dehalococcoidales bacterium]|nr:hypothetical protein [Dehalococcoidales bacterium]